MTFRSLDCFHIYNLAVLSFMMIFDVIFQVVLVEPFEITNITFKPFHALVNIEDMICEKLFTIC